MYSLYRTYIYIQQDLEKKQRLPGRILAHQTCWRKRRARAARKEEDHRTTRIRKQHGFSCASSTTGEHSTASEMPQIIAYVEQLARDSCRSAPKHPPKFSVSTHRGCRLFGETALLPLQSQVRRFASTPGPCRPPQKKRSMHTNSGTPLFPRG